MRTSAKGISLICNFEGFRDKAYQDVVGVWTIGYGFTKGVVEGMTITPNGAKIRLQDELTEYERAVENACTIPPNQNQFDALVSFAFNVGCAGMRRSSVIKAHNRGDFDSAARAFALWNKAGGKVYRGLVRRRASEASLYLEPYDAPAEPTQPLDYVVDVAPHKDPNYVPQKVDVEKPMYKSKINTGAALAGASAAAASITEVVTTLDRLKPSLENLGLWLIPIVGLAVTGFCAWIIYERVVQRREGRA